MCTLIFFFVLLLTSSSFVCEGESESAHKRVSVSKSLLEKLDKNQNSKIQQHVNLILSLQNGTIDPLLTDFETRVFPLRSLRIQSLATALQSHASTSQKNILSFLENEKKKFTRDQASSFTYTSFWITNKILIKNADGNLLQKLMEHEDVSSIEEEIIVSLQQIHEGNRLLPVQEKKKFEGGGWFKNESVEVQWGVDRIKAMEAWHLNYRGNGVVVASIDTGVTPDHEALIGNHRSENGWYDAVNGLKSPYDDSGHGTHVIGTICGKTRGIGVAPEAKFISCKSFDKNGTSELGRLIDCGQWVACPNQAPGPFWDQQSNCSDTPHIVSNSWNIIRGKSEYDDVIKVWKSMGIIPIWSIGNDLEGPKCSSIQYPADCSQDVISVGSTGQKDAVLCSSTIGPHPDAEVAASGIIKPDVVAPGLSILSADFSDPSRYRLSSGTSMACPHVSGIVALLLSKNPELTFDQVKQILTSTAEPTVSTGFNCGGINETIFPNHHVGFGLVNAQSAISLSEDNNNQTTDGISVNNMYYKNSFFISNNNKLFKQQSLSQCDSASGIIVPSLVSKNFIILLSIYLLL